MPVFVIASDGKPVMPCTPRRARLMLEKGKARVIRIKPFTIQLKDRNSDSCDLQDLQVKIDPGSKTTGFALVRKDIVNPKSITVLWLMELVHRGQQIVKALKQRAAYRRNRRSRNTRYRQARFLNRTKQTGWLPPSLMHRINTTLSWVNKLRQYSPVTMIAVERVKFDTQKMMNPNIQNEEYQRGTLFEYEIKEYLLEKFNRQCVYCDAKNIPLEKEHIIPRSRGGTNSISNLTLACKCCNRAKGNLSIEEFLKNKPDKLAKIRKQMKVSLKDTASVNATRDRLFTELLDIGLPVEIGTGALTKFNRKKLCIHKTHALDAVCVGNVDSVKFKTIHHLEVKCSGRGRYQRTITDKYGFPKDYLMKTKSVFSFMTGDIVRIFTNKILGKSSIVSKVIIRKTGNFSTKFMNSIISFNYRNCKILQKSNGYTFDIKDYKLFNINNKLVVC